MSKTDPFEAYRWKRQIEKMEAGFRDKARVRREKLQELLESEDDTLEFERKVSVEMEDFLAESTGAAERILEDLPEEAALSDDAQAEIRNHLESLLSEVAPSEPAGQRIPLPEEEGDPADRPPDLMAALARLRRRDNPAFDPGRPAARTDPAAEDPPLPARPDRQRILESFDKTCNQFSNLMRERLDQVGAEDSEDVLEEDSVPVAEPVREPAPRIDPEPESQETLVTADSREDRPATKSILGRLAREVAVLSRLLDLVVAKGIVSREEVQEISTEVEISADDTPSIPVLVRDVYRLNRLKEALLRKGVISREDLEEPERSE